MKKVIFKKLFAVLLSCVLAFSLLACGDSAGSKKSGNKSKNKTSVSVTKSEGDDKTSSADNKTSDENKSNSGVSVTVSSSEGGNGDVSSVVTNKTEVEWYVANDTVVLHYTGEGAQKLWEIYQAGRKQEMSIAVDGCDYNFEIGWCNACNKNLYFSYSDHVDGFSGKCCENPDRQMHCYDSPEITGSFDNGDLWFCVRHFTPNIISSSPNGIRVHIGFDYDNYVQSDDFYDEISGSSISFYDHLPEQYSNIDKFYECSNVHSLGDFPAELLQYAKTDDYRLYKYPDSEQYDLDSYDKKGNVIGRTSYFKSPMDGSITITPNREDMFDLSGCSKYSDLSTYRSDPDWYFMYFTKPYLSLEQISTINN